MRLTTLSLTITDFEGVAFKVRILLCVKVTLFISVVFNPSSPGTHCSAHFLSLLTDTLIAVHGAVMLI